MVLEPIRITMRWPDNWHNHFREKGDPRFEPTVGYIATQFKRANAMGNFPKPILTAAQMLRHKADIKEAAEKHGFPDFEPLMVGMLSHETTPQMVEELFNAGAYGMKDMPANGTTNSGHGIFDRKAPLYHDCLKVMAELGMSWLGHCEVPFKDGAAVPMKDRSRLFIPVLDDIRTEFPLLKMCIEHIDIKELVEWVVVMGDEVSATVTPHHMEVTADDADHDNHLKCMPYPKEPEDIAAIVEVVMAGHPRFFYGSDNAPHLLPDKLKATPNSGVFTAPVEIGANADLFEKHHSLPRMEPFMSELGAKWHGYPLNEGTITLVRQPHQVPEIITLPDGNQITPYKHGQVINWQLAAN